MQRVVSVKNPTRSLIDRSPDATVVLERSGFLTVDAGAPAVVVEEGVEGSSVGPAPGPDVAGGGLDLLDVHVGIQRQREQVVGGVAHREPSRAPVVGES